MTDINLVIKPGWHLASDQKLDKIMRMLDRNNGNCPCQKDHPKCPCNKYLEEDICCCGLYEKEKS